MSWGSGAGLGGVEKIQSADGTIMAFDPYAEGEPLVVVMGATAHRAISPNLAAVATAGTRIVIRTGEQVAW